MNSAFPHTILIEQLWISPGHDFKGRFGQSRLEHPVTSPPSIHCIQNRGIEGDRYFDFKDNFKGQITFFSAEVADALRAFIQQPDWNPIDTRRNVLTRGIELPTLIGKTFTLGTLQLYGSEHCAPCFWMDQAVAPGVSQWLEGKGGLRCKILNTATLTLGAQSLKFIDS